MVAVLVATLNRVIRKHLVYLQQKCEGEGKRSCEHLGKSVPERGNHSAKFIEIDHR